MASRTPQGVDAGLSLGKMCAAYLASREPDETRARHHRTPLGNLKAFPPSQLPPEGPRRERDTAEPSLHDSVSSCPNTTSSAECTPAPTSSLQKLITAMSSQNGPDVMKRRDSMKTLGPPGLRVVASAEKVSTLDGAALHVTHYARKTGPEAGINSIDFNQFSLRDSELVPAVVGVFDSLGLCQGMGITKQNLAKMVSKCMSLYHRQPYHNFRHAFDVLQAANLLLHGTKLAETASRPEVFSLLAAALLHDVGHPGLSNDFHKKNTTPYAVLAKPIEDTCDTLASHPNEYYHCEIMQNLLLGEDGLLPHGQFSEELRCEVGRLVQQLIFATDPATQKSFLARLDKQIEEGLDIYSTNPDDRLLALSVVIRCADTFHPFRPFSLHQYWALHITEEFAGQAKLETARRRDDNPVQSEPSKLGQDTIGFLNALVCPVLLRLITLFNSRNKPFFDLLTQRLATNKNYWESHDLRQEMRADEAKKVDCITTHHLSGHALSKDELSVSCVGYS